MKKKRQSREKYVSRTTKMEVAAHTVGPPCSCTKQCYQLIGMSTHNIIINLKYVSIGISGLQT